MCFYYLNNVQEVWLKHQLAWDKDEAVYPIPKYLTLFVFKSVNCYESNFKSNLSRLIRSTLFMRGDAGVFRLPRT